MMVGGGPVAQAANRMQQACPFHSAEHDRQPLGRLGDENAREHRWPAEGDAEDKAQSRPNLVGVGGGRQRLINSSGYAQTSSVPSLAGDRRKPHPGLLGLAERVPR
jgi:hypothetical protein